MPESKTLSELHFTKDIACVMTSLSLSTPKTVKIYLAKKIAMINKMNKGI